MRALVAAMTLLWAGAVQAQDVPVRGGEHENFTRLVLRVPDEAAWRLDPVPGGVQLGLPGGVAYDLRRAFDRIPRTRVAAMLPLGQGRLGLSIPCDCHVEATLFRGIGLVIDVLDGPASFGGLAPGPVAPVSLASGLPWLLEPPPVAPALGPLAEAIAAPPSLDQADRVAQTEAAILDSVAAAATQGLLDIAPARELPEPSSHTPAIEPLAPAVETAAASPALGAPERSATGALGLIPAEPQPGLAFRTGSDTPSQGREPLGSTGTPCRSKDDFDLAAWAGSGDFATEIGARSAQVSDDRDRIDPEAVEALAQTYIAFGFGREAMQALRMDGRSSRARDDLRVLARLVDGETPPSDAFEDQAGCLGPVALWRALARGTLQGTDERERSATTIALRLLPPAVRGLVALRLATLLLDAGDALGADEVMALADDTGTEGLLAQADIIREIEGPAPALAALENIAESDPRMTPVAVVELIDLTIAEGQAVPEDTLELARALRFEQGGEAARALLLAEVRALTAASRFDEALTLLKEERVAHPGEDLDAAMTATVQALTKNLGDPTFLELALGELPLDLPPEAREVVATRLANLGFPEEAEALRRAGVPQAQTAPVVPTADAPVLNGSLALAALATAPDLSSAGISGPEPRLAGDWREPPPLLNAPPVDPVVQQPQRTAPSDGQGTGPSVQVAATGPAEPGTDDVREEAPQASDSPEGPTTLADRRAVLDRAEEARAQAAALLAQAPIE